MESENLQSSKYDCLLFDLDDTLYPLSSGISAACAKNIKDYMGEKLRIEEDKISDVNTVLYKAYGTTMAGLRAVGYDFDYDEYHSFVHGRLPYENLKPDPLLRALLLSLPYRKVLFTNADRIHANRALGRLGLEDCFQGIICFETLNPTTRNKNTQVPMTTTKPYDEEAELLPESPIVCKPSEAAIRKAIEIANISDPERTIFFDDSVRNIQSGKRVGLHTVLVGTSRRVEGADYALESIHNIREALPQLWEVEAGDKKSEKGITYSAGKLKVAIETSVC